MPPPPSSYFSDNVPSISVLILVIHTPVSHAPLFICSLCVPPSFLSFLFLLFLRSSIPPCTHSFLLPSVDRSFQSCLLYFFYCRTIFSFVCLLLCIYISFLFSVSSLSLRFPFLYLIIQHSSFVFTFSILLFLSVPLSLQRYYFLCYFVFTFCMFVSLSVSCHGVIMFFMFFSFRVRSFPSDLLSPCFLQHISFRFSHFVVYLFPFSCLSSFIVLLFLTLFRSLIFSFDRVFLFHVFLRRFSLF